MKKLLILLLFCFPVQIFAQRVNLLTTGALIDDSTQDSAFVTLANQTNGFTGVRIFRSATEQDTINTRWVQMRNVNADITVELSYISNTSAGDSVSFYFEAFRGHGTPDSSGISRHLLETFSNVIGDTTKAFHVSDSSWVQKRLFGRYRISIYELASQFNDYVININQYSPDDESAKILR